MKFVMIFNFVISILFTLCYFYQSIYMILFYLIKQKKYKKGKIHNFAVLICARNEECVIANLIESIKKQEYPKDKIHIFVVADNCTDNTADVSRKAGATVFERFNKNEIGKGYALNFLLNKIKKNYNKSKFDGYFVFDADNVIDPQFISEVNKVFSAGYPVVTGYRNSKNYGASWISAGNALWYLRDMQFMNGVRMRLGLNSSVTGTGFLFSSDVLEKMGGWNFFTLVEDTEFTIFCTINGIRIGYAEDAILYDEQTVSFRESWNQRLRWTKGYLQVYKLYGWNLFKHFFTGDAKTRFSCYDMSMSIMPAFFLTIVSCIFNIVSFIIAIIFNLDVKVPLCAFIMMLVSSFMVAFIVGLFTTLTEWKRIHASLYKKILYIFTLPLFMLTYILVAFASLFLNVTWKPIKHNDNEKLDDILEKK